MLMPNRHGQEEDYRYGFQGQEMDNEIRGSKGTSVNYKYRMHDARIGRFFAVDPLFKDFAWNSPYAFSENRVLDAIELEGLEAFLIHGMNSSPEDWQTPEFKNVSKALIKLTNNKTVNSNFDWSGKGNGIFQTKADRTKAAERLVQHILDNKVEGEEITLIGASHGANVSIQAAKMLGEMGYEVNLISINRTSYNEEGDSENPDGNNGINDHIDIRTKNDKVYKFVRGGGTENKYEGDGQQLILTNKKIFFLFRHATKNIKVEQIENSNLEKLKKVDEECTPSACENSNSNQDE